MKKPALLCALMAAAVTLGGAQTAVFELNTAYLCPGETTFKVLSCAGSAPSASCQIETSVGLTRFPGQSTRSDILALMPLCRRQTTLEAQAAAMGGVAGSDINGFKIRDQVQVSTSQGWKTALIVAMNGNDYRVLLPDGSELVKLYPGELRRTGPLTARDRALGQFNLKERVQFLLDGKVESGEITAIKGLDYEIQLSPTRFVWTNGRVLLLTPDTASETAGVKPGAPPIAGLTRCGSALDGLYMPRGEVGLIVELRSGNARVRALNGNDHTMECWMGVGGKIYLHRPGQPAATDTLIEVQGDGSLKTPIGKSSKPPLEGVTSCAGAIDGRFAPPAGVAGLTIEFLAEDARVRMPDGAENVLECWTGNGKIYLSRSGQSAAGAIILEIQSNGSLKTPQGNISRQ